MSVSETLRRAIRKSDQTLYRIAQDAGVDWSILQRFLDGTRPNIRLDTVEKLCVYLGLKLRPATARRGRRSGSCPIEKCDRVAGGP
jgi:DNA-binding Xre family transcriptional regulator